MTLPPSCLIPPGLARGSIGPAVATLQEWLTLHGQRIAIDGEFGPATERALMTFSLGHKVVNAAVAAALVRPMRRALEAEGSIVDIARAHIAEHPREVGGQNRGPWCRLASGDAGEGRAWCLDEVLLWARQAGVDTSLLSPSCDVTAARARSAGRLSTTPRVGDVFLVRRTSTDWTHGGVVLDVGPGWIATAEGNSNDEGSREGFEACERVRGLGRLDFVRMVA